MALIYAASDIHGCLHAFEEALALIDLENKENQLILCGDYIDNGPESCEVLYRVKELTEIYPNQIVTIMGNHEDMFLEFLKSKESDVWNLEWLGTDKEFNTVYSFVSATTKTTISSMMKEIRHPDTYYAIAKVIKADILSNHKNLIEWIKKMPLYYETEDQIFVHAGIDEESEDYWKHVTTRECFLSKFPADFGKFYKDVIAGHISTRSLAKDKDYHGVYWDGKSHFYLDGVSHKSGIVPVLKYDTVSKKYSSFRKQLDETGDVGFEEYFVAT